MDRSDSILVHVVTYEDGKEILISAYTTTCVSETLKLFLTAKEFDVPCEFSDHDSSIKEEYRLREFYIDDVWLSFGSQEHVQTIEVIVL